MSECTVLGLKEELGKEGMTLVDVREHAEFAGGRVSGAKLVPLREIESRHTELDHSHTVYVMCRSGRRSSEAQKRLRALGFSNVVNVRGGFEAWKKEDLPVERDERAPWALDRQVRFIAGLMIVAASLLAYFVSPHFVWLAAFVGAGLAYAGATDWCGMAMLLSKMPWNRDHAETEV
jgi:rhodanese-related sulfurtransferase